MFDFIFETVFDFFSAWDMLGLMLMGTVFIIIGILFIGYELYWRLKADKTDGVIAAVKQNGKYYYSILKYIAPNGQTYEKDSSLGSNSILSRLPGTKIKVLIMPNNPEKVRRPTLIWLIFGTVFLIPGLFIMNLALKKFEFNYMIALFILAALLFGGERIYKFYKKITKSEFDRQLLSEFWQDIKSGKKPTSKSPEIKGKILQNHEIIEKATSQLKYSKLSALIFIILSLGLGVFGYYNGQEMINMTNNGIRTTGTVIGMDTRDNAGEAGYSYYAIIRYSDQNDEPHRFTDNIGSSTPLYNRNDEVNVLYIPNEPNSAMIDRGIFNWGMSTIAALLALWSLWGAFLYFTAQNRFEKQRLLIPQSKYVPDE